MTKTNIIVWMILLYGAYVLFSWAYRKICDRREWQEFFAAGKDRATIHKDFLEAEEAIRCGRLIKYKTCGQWYWGRPHREGGNIRLGLIKELTKIDAIRLINR